jgi:hypothetical protein
MLFLPDAAAAPMLTFMTESATIALAGCAHMPTLQRFGAVSMRMYAMAWAAAHRDILARRWAELNERG